MEKFTSELRDSVRKILNPVKVDSLSTDNNIEDFPMGITLQLKPRVHYLWISTYPGLNDKSLGDITLTIYILDSEESFIQSKPYLVGASIPEIDFPETYPVKKVKGLLFHRTVTVRFTPDNFTPMASYQFEDIIFSNKTTPELILHHVSDMLHFKDFDLDVTK